MPANHSATACNVVSTTYCSSSRVSGVRRARSMTCRTGMSSTDTHITPSSDDLAARAASASGAFRSSQPPRLSDGSIEVGSTDHSCSYVPSPRSNAAHTSAGDVASTRPRPPRPWSTATSDAPDAATSASTLGMSSHTNWPPTSTRWPAASITESVLPPTRSRASNTSTARPARSSSAAAVSPANPAPTTTTSQSKPDDMWGQAVRPTRPPSSVPLLRRMLRITRPARATADSVNSSITVASAFNAGVELPFAAA